MAKKEGDETDAGGGARPAKTNGLDPKLVGEFVGRIENLNSDIATEKGEYMARCKTIREDIALVYDEAKDKGLTKKALKAKIKERALAKQLANCRDNLEGEQLDMFDLISQALGDTKEAA